jgi:hypothetical protein
MSIEEWLGRLNHSKYIKAFKKQGIELVTDLRHVQDEGQLQELFGIKQFMIKKRIMSMIRNDEISK